MLHRPIYLHNLPKRLACVNCLLLYTTKVTALVINNVTICTQVVTKSKNKVVGCGLWVVGCGLWVVGCGLWVVGKLIWLVVF
jgi:hypothetical protein